jgi:hypothetical protein
MFEAFWCVPDTDQASSFIKNPAFYTNTANMDIKAVIVVCSKITNGKVTERDLKKVYFWTKYICALIRLGYFLNYSFNFQWINDNNKQLSLAKTTSCTHVF